MSLFVGRLRTGIATEPLRAHFEQFGPLLRFEYRGMYAFVTYETDEQAMRCMESGRSFGNGRMKIEWAKESKNYDGPRRPAVEGCFVCLEVGHFARECPNRFREATYNSHLIEGYESYPDRFRDEPGSVRGPDPRGYRSAPRPQPRGGSAEYRGTPPPPPSSSSSRHGQDRYVGSPPHSRDHHPRERGSPPSSRYPASPRGGHSPPPPHSYRDYGDRPRDGGSHSRDYDSREHRRAPPRETDFRESRGQSPERRAPPHYRDSGRGGHTDRDVYSRSSPPRGSRMQVPRFRSDEHRGREGGYRSPHRGSPSPQSPGSPRQKRTRAAQSPPASPNSEEKKPRAL